MTSMIVTTMRLRVSPDNRRELTQTMHSLLRLIRDQKGCLGSRLYTELGDEPTLCLIEEWDSAESCNNHLMSADFAVLLGAVSVFNQPPDVEFRMLEPTAKVEMVDAINERISSLGAHSK